MLIFFLIIVGIFTFRNKNGSIKYGMDNARPKVRVLGAFFFSIWYKNEDLWVYILHVLLDIGFVRKRSLSWKMFEEWENAGLKTEFCICFGELGSIKFIQGLAPDFVVLMVGEPLAGVGIGYVVMIAPVYIGEIWTNF